MNSSADTFFWMTRYLNDATWFSSAAVAAHERISNGEGLCVICLGKFLCEIFYGDLMFITKDISLFQIHCGPKQPRIQTEVLSYSLVHLIVCSQHSLVCSLAHFAHLLMGQWMIRWLFFSVFFSILDHSEICEKNKIFVAAENGADAVLVNCGHLSCCVPCGQRSQQSNGKCPICRAPIRQVIKVYKATADRNQEAEWTAKDRPIYPVNLTLNLTLLIQVSIKKTVVSNSPA